jgi:hypothetical protein
MRLKLPRSRRFEPFRRQGDYLKKVALSTLGTDSQGDPGGASSYQIVTDEGYISSFIVRRNFRVIIMN